MYDIVIVLKQVHGVQHLDWQALIITHVITQPPMQCSDYVPDGCSV